VEVEDGDVDRADTGGEVEAALVVELACSITAGSAVLPAGSGIGVRGGRGVDHVLEQAPHQIWRRLGRAFTMQDIRVDIVGCGHRDDSVRQF